MLDTKLEKLLEHNLPNDKSVAVHLNSAEIDLSKAEISRDQLIKVLMSISSDGAYLSRPNINDVLNGFGFDVKLSKDEDILFEDIWNTRNKNRRNKLHSVIETKKGADVEQLENEIESLKLKVETLNDKDSPEVAQLRETVDKIATQSRKIAAPIKIPSPKNMEVQLVSADSLHRLSEYNSDINILLTLSAVFLGAFLGMLGNLLFTSNVTNQAYGVIVILSVVSILFFGLYYRADQRKKDLSKDIFSQDEGVYIDDYKA